jgi:hypothetical protein
MYTCPSCVAYNNLFWLVTGSAFGSIAHDYSWLNANLGTLGEPNAVTGTVDPLVDWKNGDFGLLDATEAGKTLPAPYNVDMFGTVRGGDGVWDRGAIEYSKTNIEYRLTNDEYRSPHIPAQINDIQLKISDGQILNLFGQVVNKDGAVRTGIYFIAPDEENIQKQTFVRH